MSLTSELKSPQSQATQFMRSYFPNTRRVMALCREQLGKDFQTCRPNGQVPWPLIGTALDYRLRFYFPQVGRKDSIKNLVCYSGASKACGGKLVYDGAGKIQSFLAPKEKQFGYLEAEVLLDFFANLENSLGRLAPTQRRLDEADENVLLRYCVVMAALDFFRRAGYDPSSVLLNPKPKQTLDELLSVSADAWIDDLRCLSWNFYNKFSPLLSGQACLNPTFDGSLFIGGADADLIVDHSLIDIKTTIDPLKDAGWIYQLLGYVLLDWHDENKLQKVAIYFSRQSYLLEWDIDDLLSELMTERLSLSELRQRWYDVVGADYFGKDEVLVKEFSEASGYTKIDGKWKRTWTE